MCELSKKFVSLVVNENIFKDIKYFVSGEVHEKIEELLNSGGAERINYFSDYVTHLIVGKNPEETDVSDATDLYEIPAVTSKWVLMCARLKRLVNTKPYVYSTSKIFFNLNFTFSKIEDRLAVWSLITYNGGCVYNKLSLQINFLVTTDISSPKFLKSESLGSDIIKIVTPDWVMEAVKHCCLPDPSLFHPKLINWPKPLKPHESTTAITGFEPDNAETVEEVEKKDVSDSTQALLEKLKSRMPWNQLPTMTSTASDPIAPPNVVAPSFLSKLQLNAQQTVQPNKISPPAVPSPSQAPPPQSPVSTSFSNIPQSPTQNQQIPRSVVHHTQTSQVQQSTFTSQQNPLNISRLIGQPQTQPRPSLQQLRGQLTQSQLQQQLLQQRIQQNQQSLGQRTSGSMTVQQQLLQQQLVQEQRQLLQNQLSNQQNQLSNPQNQLSSQQNHQQQQIQGQLIGQQQQIQNQLIGQPQLSQSHLLGQQQGQQQLLSHQQQQQNQLSQQGQNQSTQEQILSQQSGANRMQQTVQSHLIGQAQINNSQQQQVQNQGQNQFNQQQGQNQLMNQRGENQLINQQQQINQHQGQNQLVSQQQHGVNQLLGQQLEQQLQQLKQNQSQQQSQQHILSQSHQNLNLNQSQLQMPQPNQLQSQQLLQNRVIQQQIGQQPQQIQNQNFGQTQQLNLSQHIMQQKQQLFNQQQIVNSQQQIIQNQPNLAIQQQQQQQQQFGGQNFIQNQQDNIQQKVNKPQISQQNQTNQPNLNQLNVQALNQQLSTQNLGQQLNQQQLNQQAQQLNQNSQLNQSSINQQISLDQNLTQSQLSQTLNQALGQNLNPQQNIQLNQLTQSLNQQLGQQQQQQQQMGQLNSAVNQQVVRTQFPQGNVINQQMLLNQQQGQQQQSPRQQINQHLWSQPQQQGQNHGQQIIRHPVNVIQQSAGGPRIQWSPNQQQQGNVVHQRQFIQLDAHTHNQLQKMPPDQQAAFVAKLQKQRQLQLAKQVQQTRAGGHILIRGNVPPGLTAQQQVQWLQQQAKQQGIVLPPNIQQNITPGTLTPQSVPAQGTIQHAPGLSPINQNAAQFSDQAQQQQLQLRQYRLQQLQIQREQAQKNHLAQQGSVPQQQGLIRPIGQPQTADSTTNPPQIQDGNLQHSLVVNAKTKTALANMLSSKLQSGGTICPPRPDTLPEPSAAGTLRLMTAQHNAALNSKPQEIIALQQRRVISGPNGEIIKPSVPQLPLTPQNDPPKLQYCQKPPLPMQHRVGPFYGHNPNLKLPPDLFLLGCIFVVVEVEDVLEDRCAGWQQKIEKYGGEVEKQYCSKVTHVLCETQRHGVVMQALRDCKRCVTILWLMDVMQRKQVLPPWTALHLPQIYLDIAPAAKHLISITGFEGIERIRVKEMIKYIGAKFTSYFSKHNTLLISTKSDGKKCNKAKKWGIPVVNVQWLTDVILGNFTALNQMDNQTYQTFSSPPNMSFDPKLVPNMMHAWKAPINISQESYERVKRSTSPVILPKTKKQKTEHIDENDNISEEIRDSDYKVLFSQFDVERVKVLEKMTRELGGAVSKDQRDFTHLVMPRLIRSIKLLLAISKGLQIVSEQWLIESHSSKQFLPETNFTLDPEEFNKTYKVNIEKTLQCFNRDRLFEGKYFWITPSVFPSKKVVAELIQSCGGVVERIRRSGAQIEATNSNAPLSYFIITAKQDLHLVADLLKHKKDKQKVVCSVEFVFSAILKQNIEVDSCAVSVM